MSGKRISATLRRRLSAWSGERCCYCQTQERVSGAALTVEHIVPEALGGASDEQNLCLACRSCNEHKAARVDALDPACGGTAPLFHPRQDEWNTHFTWSPDGTRVVGLTATGRATVEALNMNHPLILQARRLWVQAGWHPPAARPPRAKHDTRPTPA